MDTSSAKLKIETSHKIDADDSKAASVNDSYIDQDASTEVTDPSKAPENKNCPQQSESPKNNFTSVGTVSEQESAESKEADESQSLPVDRTQTQFEGDHSYELLGGTYYYTDETTQLRYKYDDSSGEWVVENASDSKSIDSGIDQSDGNVHVDEEGRTYYYADNRYLCRYPTGHVYYMDEKNEWVLWDSDAPALTNEDCKTGDQSCLGEDVKATDGATNDNSKWYYYRGKDAFYRDHTSNTVFKLNKDSNEWEAHKEKGVKRKKKQRPKGTEEEEFDTESSSEEIEEDDQGDEVESGAAPPGYKNDPNISFDGENYIKKDKDEMLYEWDVNRRAWFPKLDDHFMARYQMSYGFNPDGSKNENPVKYDDDEEDYEEELEKERMKKKEDEKKKKEKKPAGWFDADNMNNTKVYVSHLPDDLSEQQFVDLMQKCGLVLKDPESGDYKVKLYKDEQGNFKGDALCTYIKVESVDLALQILDGACVGPRSTERITVERAKFQMRGAYNAALKPKKKKKKLLEKIQKKQEKLFSWHPEPLRGQRGKHENVIIIRNAFEPSEFDDHAERILSHTESLRAQCSSFGTVKKLELFDRHSQGVVKVVFSDVEAADLCITSMNNRLYNKRKLTVGVWDGVEGFKVEETSEERAARIKKWDEFLMKGGNSKGADDRSKVTNKDIEDSKTVDESTFRETSMDSELSEGESNGDCEVTSKERQPNLDDSEEDCEGTGEVESNSAMEISEVSCTDSPAVKCASKKTETDLKVHQTETKVEVSSTIETDEDSFRATTPVEEVFMDTKTNSKVPEKEFEAESSTAMEPYEDSSKGDTTGSDVGDADISQDTEDKKLEGSEGRGGAENAKPDTG